MCAVHPLAEASFRPSNEYSSLVLGAFERAALPQKQHLFVATISSCQGARSAICTPQAAQSQLSEGCTPAGEALGLDPANTAAPEAGDVTYDQRGQPGL